MKRMVLLLFISTVLVPRLSAAQNAMPVATAISQSKYDYRVLATVFLFGVLIAVRIRIGNGCFPLARNVVSVLPSVSTKLSIM